MSRKVDPKHRDSIKWQIVRLVKGLAIDKCSV